MNLSPRDFENYYCASWSLLRKFGSAGVGERSTGYPLEFAAITIGRFERISL